MNKTFYADLYGYKVYLIDAFKFRDSSPDHEEFGNWATKEFFKDIPDKEIWVDNRVDSRDIELFMFTAIKNSMYRSRGMNEHEAYNKAIKDETRIRNGLDKDIKKEFLSEGDDFKVYKVDGFAIRNKYYAPFTQGGNSEVYKWIPKNEIYLEKSLTPDEMYYIIMHEAYERHLMKDGLSYDEAHKKASKLEFNERKKYERVSSSSTS